MPEELKSVPSDAVVDTLLRTGAVTQAEVQMAAELVWAQMEISRLKALDPEDEPEPDDSAPD